MLAVGLWTAIELFTDICGPQGIKPPDFGDSLTLPCH